MGGWGPTHPTVALLAECVLEGLAKDLRTRRVFEAGSGPLTPEALGGQAAPVASRPAASF